MFYGVLSRGVGRGFGNFHSSERIDDCGFRGWRVARCVVNGNWKFGIRIFRIILEIDCKYALSCNSIDSV